jgi:hypothetical protein
VTDCSVSVSDKQRQHRRGDVVGQVGADHGSQAVKLLCNQFWKIQLQNIAGDHLGIGIIGQRFRQYRQQRLIEFHGYDLAGPLCQFHRQRADAGTNLQNAAAFIGAGGLRNGLRNGGIDEKILSHGLGKAESVAEQKVLYGFIITKIHDDSPLENKL